MILASVAGMQSSEAFPVRRACPDFLLYSNGRMIFFPSTRSSLPQYVSTGIAVQSPISASSAVFSKWTSARYFQRCCVFCLNVSRTAAFGSCGIWNKPSRKYSLFCFFVFLTRKYGDSCEEETQLFGLKQRIESVRSSIFSDPFGVITGVSAFPERQSKPAVSIIVDL